MSYIYKGMFAGLVAAIVAAAGMHAASQLASLQAYDFVTLIGNLSRTGYAGGLLIHCAIGTLWGGLFAWLDPDLPGDNLRQRGVILSIAICVLLLVLLFPLTGYGFMGLRAGWLMPAYAAAVHVAFGAIMGGFYAWLFVQALPMRYRLSGWSRTLPLR